jgi:hypothetical protein
MLFQKFFVKHSSLTFYTNADFAPFSLKETNKQTFHIDSITHLSKDAVTRIKDTVVKKFFKQISKNRSNQV